MDSLYLENLDEAINDEGKIVSYKWLSTLLKVSSNIAKQMLFQYWTNHKSSNKDFNIHATYLISGIIPDPELKQDVHKICVVNEIELPVIKSQMKQLFSLHIYSIQKSILRDKNLITAANIDKGKEYPANLSKFSGITFPNLKYRDNCAVPIQTEDPIRSDVKSEPKPVTKEQPQSKKITPKTALTSMFANQQKKNEAAPIKSGPKRKTVTNKPNKQGSLSAFFTKGREPLSKNSTEQSTKHNDEHSSNKSSEDIKQEIEVKEEMEIDIKEEEMVADIKEEVKLEETEELDAKENIVPAAKATKANTKNVKVTKGATKQKTKRKSEENNSQSKRRRIMQIDSSDSNSEEEETTEECPLPPTPPPLEIIQSDEEILPPTLQENSTGKRRVKKLVDTRFMNEGFLVTNKEYEFVSDESDSENPLPLKPVIPSTKPDKTAIKKLSPKKRKLTQSKAKQQPSIMNFFKKK